MTEAFGQILPFALVIALSPIPLVAVIAMLFSRRAVPNGLGFLLGWIMVVAAGLVAFTALASTTDLGSNDEPSTTATVVRGVLGLLLVAGAVKTWRGRSDPDEDVAMPAWMARIETIGPVGAFGLALLLGGVNPKNLAMNLAAAATLAAAELSRSELAVEMALYTGVASASVAVIVGYRLLTGERGAATLERMRGWLVANDATVMSVLFLVFGVKLLGDAISGW